jgi:hypothetical protein
MSEDLPAWRLDAVRAEPMGQWTALLRDANPIHVDAAAAEALGFGPHTVNPGPTNLAYAINMLMAARPGTYPREIRARFGANILSDDVVEVTGAADPEDPNRCQATVRVPARDVVSVEVDATLIAREDLP